MGLYIVWLVSLTCMTWFNEMSCNIMPNVMKNTRNENKNGKPFGLMTWLNNFLQKRPKYILVWPNIGFPFSHVSQGQKEFIKLKCPETNCYVTSNRKFFQDIREFDAIAFIGKKMARYDLPKNRAQHQKYIFLNMESSPNYPVEDKEFDDFFNWTATYRLDSDIPLPYLLIKDKDGNIVGPQRDMNWIPEEEVDQDVVSPSIIRHKTRAAAIFTSNCHTLSERELVIIELQKELHRFGLTVDLYGSCGPYRCYRSRAAICKEMLTRGYYFYLSYENSVDIDYVTEKLLTPLQYNLIPVVYGGANYSRFLPPGSYLDATEISAWKLAKTMADLITSPKKYMQYFWWKKYYSYHDPVPKENMCSICATINNNDLWRQNKTYVKFRKWWNINGYD